MAPVTRISTTSTRSAQDVEGSSARIRAHRACRRRGTRQRLGIGWSSAVTRALLRRSQQSGQHHHQRDQGALETWALLGSIPMALEDRAQEEDDDRRGDRPDHRSRRLR